MFSLSTRIHAFIDYSFALFLMLAPAIFGFGEADRETIIPIIAGMTICFYSFFTKYEGGFYPLFSIRTHYLFDLAIGILVATSPWIFGFRDFVYRPHLVIGFAFMIVAIIGLRPMVRFQKPRLFKPMAGFIKFV